MMFIMKFAKSIALLTSYYLMARVPSSPETVMDFFDYGLGVGLLVIVALMLYRGWESSIQYNNKRYRKREEYVDNNRKASEVLREWITEMVGQEKEVMGQITSLHRGVDEVRGMLKNNKERV